MSKCCNIVIGMLKTPVVIVKVTQTVNDAGNPHISVTSSDTIKVIWEHLSTSKLVFGYKLDPQVKIKLIARWNTNITHQDKIQQDNVVHDIRSIRRINNEGKADLYGRYMEILIDGGSTSPGSNISQVNVI